MAKETTKKVTAPKKVAGAKKETAAKVKAAKSDPKKPDVSFDKFLSPAPEQEKAAAPIENVDFDAFVNSKEETPATTTKTGRVQKKELKSLDFEPEIKDVDLEKLKEKAHLFTGKVYGMRFVRRNMLEDFAREEFGDAITSSIGKNPSEIVFDIHGVRVPEEGVFFIR